MKKTITAIYTDKFSAQCALESINEISQKNVLSVKLFSPISFSPSLFPLKFILFGSTIGYIIGSLISVFRKDCFFEVSSMMGLLSGAVFGVILYALTSSFSKKKKSLTIINVGPADENFYSIIKRMKKSRAIKIYFTFTDNFKNNG